MRMIIVFGSINLDVIFALAKIPTSGETLLSSAVTLAPGGKGGNQAVAAARDGAVVKMAGAVGRDALAAGALVGLRDAGVDISRVIEVAATTGCAAIFVAPTGDNAIGVGSGANLLARAAQVENSLLSPETTLLLQMEVPARETEDIIRRARARGARIILNLAPAAPLAREALALVDLLVVNEAEAAWLGGHLGCAPGALHQALGVDVVRTLGAAGAVFSGQAGTINVPAHPVAVVDTTAAGDAFTGVLAAALDRGLPIAAALRRASVAAGLTCTRHGTQNSLPTRAETDAAVA
jgi:ribokinase